MNVIIFSQLLLHPPQISSRHVGIDGVKNEVKAIINTYIRTYIHIHLLSTYIHTYIQN
jgi:hypothetical protein